MLSMLILNYLCRVKAVNSGKSLRPQQGPKTKLSRENEKEIAQYLDECWEFGIPKKKSDLKDEIVHFMECYKIPNTFPNTKPGVHF